jgi:diaminopimelate decarboxylase
MLIALEPIRDLSQGQSRLAEILDKVRSGNNFSHAALSRLNTTRFDDPTILFDLNTIEERMHCMSAMAKSESMMPLVAVKSCPQPEFLTSAMKLQGGFDISNLAEYNALPSDLTGKLVSITSPVLEGDLGDFTSKGNSVLVTLDSRVQLDYYFGQSSSIDYVLRIQGSDLLRRCEPADTAFYPETRFGFSMAEAASLLQDPRLQINPPSGFHVHHGSERNQVSTYKSIISGLEKLAQLLPQPAKYINLGGGWHAMSDGDIITTLRNARQHFPLPCAILLEPGRWYAGNAGFAVGKIVNLTQSGSVYRYTLNLSGKSHLHWSQGKLLHSLESDYNKACVVQFLGPSCFEGDFIGQFLVPYRDNFIQDSGLSLGKQVIFTGISTYSAAWNTAFNGIPQADVVWLRA